MAAPESAPAESAPASMPAPATSPSPSPASAPAPTPAAPAAKAPRASLFPEGTLILTLNRLGVLFEGYLRFRMRLYESRSDVFAENYAGVGFVTQTSPVFSLNGLYAEIAPSAFFRVTAGYQLVAYYGILNSMLTFDGADAASSCGSPLAPEDRDTRCVFDVDSFGPRLDNAHSDWGHRFYVTTRLRAKVWRLVLVDNFSVERWSFRAGWSGGSGADSWWYNELIFLVQERNDWAITNAASLMFTILPDRGGSKPHVMVGIDDRLSYAVNAKYLTNRMGLIGVFRIPEWKKWNDLAIALLVSPWTHDRYKAYGEGPEFRRSFLPFVGIVFNVARKSFL